MESSSSAATSSKEQQPRDSYNDRQCGCSSAAMCDLAVHCFGGVHSLAVPGPSGIPGGGMGLFCTAITPRDTRVAVYHTGIALDSRAAFALVEKSFLMRLGNGNYIDANPHGPTPPTQCSKGPYVNDARIPLLYNTYTVKRPHEARADVYAARNLAAGEELFADYGRRYWQSAGIKPARLPPARAAALLATLGTVDPEWYECALRDGRGNREGGWVATEPEVEPEDTTLPLHLPASHTLDAAALTY